MFNICICLFLDAYQRCDFEMNLCDWSQNRDDDLDWLWMTGNQGAQGGAPGVDHTLNNPSGEKLWDTYFFCVFPNKITCNNTM